MNLATFKKNLRTTALARQADLFARADAVDAQAANAPFESAKRRRLHASAASLRDEASRLGDRYHALVAA